MTIVLGLEPAFFPVMQTWMRHYATSGGRTFVKVRYPNIPSARNAATGVDRLDDALHATAGQVVVFGHSMGAQVIYKWLREVGPTSDIDPTRVKFLSCGNPERKYGGTLRVPTVPRTSFGLKVQPTYGGPGIPGDTPYTVIDYVRQYDWWADYPNVENPSTEAMRNASVGIHMNYWGVGLDDPDVRSHTEGNVTYLLKPTRLKSPSQQEIVEQSYIRPGLW